MMDSEGTPFAEVSETTSFLHHFSGLPDHRQAGKVDYPPNLLHPFPEKPKGMHWRSYRRIKRVYETAKRSSK
jgi:hypothetical protein